MGWVERLTLEMGSTLPWAEGEAGGNKRGTRRKIHRLQDPLLLCFLVIYGGNSLPRPHSCCHGGLPKCMGALAWASETVSQNWSLKLFLSTTSSQRYENSLSIWHVQNCLSWKEYIWGLAGILSFSDGTQESNKSHGKPTLFQGKSMVKGYSTRKQTIHIFKKRSLKVSEMD